MNGALLSRRVRATGRCQITGPAAGSAEWLRLARIARILSWLTLAWMGIEGGVAIFAALLAGSVALLGFGLDSGIEAMASVIVIWRFTGTRLASATSERRARQLVALSFFLLAPYIAVEAVRALAAGDRAETSIVGLALTAGTAVFEPALGLAKRRIGARLGSSATAGEGTQNLLCAYLARRCSPGWPPTCCSAPGGSTARSRWESLPGRWSKGNEHGPGDHAAAHPSQGRRAEDSQTALAGLSIRAGRTLGTTEIVAECLLRPCLAQNRASRGHVA
jgi:hypothetical protein